MSYTDLNAELVEEFGNLERLCNQIYNAQHGVTCYIEDMERTYGGSYRVANCDQDIGRLKDVRHKRNKLSHGEVSFTSPWATEEDIDFTVDFRDRILNGTDPLSKNRKIIEARSAQNPRTAQNNSQSAYTRSRPSYSAPSKPRPRPLGCGSCLTMFAIAAAAVAWLLLQI